MALGTLPLINVFAKRFSSSVHPVSMELQQELAGVATVVEETVTGIRVVKGFGAEAIQAAELRRSGDRVYDRSITLARIRAAFNPVIDFLPALGLVAVLWYGGHQVIDGHLTIGELVAFNAYIVMLICPLRMTGQIIAQAQRAVASAERVQEILLTAPEIVDGARRPVAAARRRRGAVHRRVVRLLAGNSAPVLDGLDLVVRPGEAVALVGATGCGKTTVARLIPRFYEVSGGSLKIDGVDVREVKVKELREAVGIVFEDTFLFSDSIRANIAFANPDASDEQVVRAAHSAGAHEFIVELPEGYDTRDRRARLLAVRRPAPAHRDRPRHPRRPRVLILDDATSSVDPTKEHEIREALAEVMRGPHDHRHRPPPGHHRVGRPRRPAGGRAGGGGRHPRRPARNQRALSRGLGEPARGRHALGRARARSSGRSRLMGRRGGGGGGGGMWGGDSVVDDEDRIDSTEAKRVVRRAARFLRPYRTEIVIGIIVMVLSTLATLAGPALVRYGIDKGLGGQKVVGAGKPKRDPHALDLAAGAYLAVAFASLLLARAQIMLLTRVGEKFLRDLRIRVFDHIQAMSMAFFDGEQTGRLVARMTSDIDSLQELVQQGLVMFVQSGLLLVFSIIVLISLSPMLSLVCLVAIPLVAAASIRFRTASNRAYLKVRDRIGQTLTLLQEGLSGVRVIQAFGREDIQESRFNKRNNAQLDAQMHAIRISAMYFPVIELSGVVTTAALIGIGGMMVHSGYATVGTVAAFVLYLGGLFEPIQNLSQLFNTLQSAGAALSKIFGLLDTSSPILERPGAVDLPPTGAIEVRDVAFAYDGRKKVLSDVSLTIAPGERLALVGPTGAGKSTLAKLIARLYDPTDGSISFGGIDLRDSTLASLRRTICVVPQEGFLFNGSILDNVRVGRQGASDDEVRAALATIGCERRFSLLPEGLDTEVRERGHACRPASANSSRWRARRWPRPMCWCSTKRRPTSTPAPRPTSSGHDRADAGPHGDRDRPPPLHRGACGPGRGDRRGGGLLELGTHDELVARGGRYADLLPPAGAPQAGRWPVRRAAAPSSRTPPNRVAAGRPWHHRRESRGEPDDGVCSTPEKTPASALNVQESDVDARR